MSKIITLGLGMALFVVNSGVAQNEDLLASWPLDQTSGTIVQDQSGNGFSGAISGAQWRPDEGHSGGALFFNGGGDQVSFGTQIGSSQALTVAFWMHPSTVSLQIPIDKLPSAGNAGWSIKLRDNNELWVRIGSESSHSDLVIPNAYDANQWLHVAFSFEEGKLAAYLNGKVVGTKSGISQQVGGGSADLRMGNPANSGEMYNGLIDEVLIYDRVLSLEEIQALNGITVDYPETGDLVLWYDQPAGDLFTNALPIGNGLTGGMIYGNVENERIGLNEGTVWSGYPGNNNRTGAAGYLEEVRQLIFSGNYLAADQLAGNMVSSGNQAFQPVGDLLMTFEGHQATDYYRELDLKSAIVTTTYTHQGVQFTREYFASYPDQVMVVRVYADQPGQVNYSATLTTQHTPAQTYTEGNNRIVLNGQADAVEFQTIAEFRQSGGTSVADNGQIQVAGADTSTILLSIGTNFNAYNDVSGDQQARAEQKLQSVSTKSFHQLQKDHLEDYWSLFNRVQFDPGPANSYSKYPTDIRVANFNFSDDPQLVRLYYQYGRYLLISCSRPGGQPANLQGIWNDLMSPPWGSNYTTNINTEMNYWMAETASLPECATPLIDKIQAMVPQGELTAQTHWGVTNGWVLHHNSDLWNHTAPVDGQWGIWPTGAAWLCTHLWEHYLFNPDPQYLAEVYPTMRSAAQFFLETLVEEPVSGNNYLVTCPSTSPENMPTNGSWTCFGPAMDNQLIRDLFSSVMESSQVLNVDLDLYNELAAAIVRLPPDQIGQFGQLQEWFHDWDNPQDGNRHISHLYGLFPGAQITRRTTPDLWNAAKVTLEHRGDLSTGWSLAWKINFWARQEDGDHAYNLIRLLLTPERTYNNLFDAHPPFQIDGNFGAVSGVNEMLLQSQNNELHFLPALPSVWPAGEIHGLRARNRILVDEISWNDGELTQVQFTSGSGGMVNLRYGSLTKQLETEPGGVYTLDQGLNLIDVSTTQAPFGGQVHVVPGTIEAEDYDQGGQSVAYNDVDSENKLGAYRVDQGVDIESTGDVQGEFNVGWIEGGEWLEYTVDVQHSGSYIVHLRVASGNEGVKSMHVEMDGQDITGAISFDLNDGWQNYQMVSINTSPIDAGQHVLRVVIDQGGFNLNFLSFEAATVTGQIERQNSWFALQQNPIPRGAHLTIDALQNGIQIAHVTVQNSLGQTVQITPIKTENAWQLTLDPNLESGWYCLTIFSDTGHQETHRLLVK